MDETKNYLPKVAFLCLVILMIIFSQARAATPAALFQGYDSVLGAARLAATKGKYSEVGAVGSVEYRMYTDASSVRRDLGISESASASFGPFGGGDEKVNFFNSLQTTKYSVSVVIHAKQIESNKVVQAASLLDGIRPDALLNFRPRNEQLKVFFSSYGDSYVSSIKTGGEYIAVYTFRTETRNQQTQLAASINTTLNFGAIAGGGNIQATLDSISQSAQTEVTFSQHISGIKNPTYPSPDRAIQYALDFPAKHLDAPTVIAFETTGYERVPHAGSLGEIATNRDYFIGANGDEGVSGKLIKLQQLQAQIKRISDTYRFYGVPDDPDLAKASRQVETDIGVLNAQIKQFEASPTDKMVLPQLPSLALGTPSLNFKFQESAVCGGGGGAPFSDIDLNTAIYRRVRLAAVQLRSGSWIDAIGVSYEADGTAGPWVYHGGSTGAAQSQLQILPKQFITRVDANCDANSPNEAYVKKLSLVIGADGRSTSGGGGATLAGVTVTWMPPANAVLIGFKGRSGGALDQLQAIYVTFGPTIWQH